VQNIMSIFQLTTTPSERTYDYSALTTFMSQVSVCLSNLALAPLLYPSSILLPYISSFSFFSNSEKTKKKK